MTESVTREELYKHKEECRETFIGRTEYNNTVQNIIEYYKQITKQNDEVSKALVQESKHRTEMEGKLFDMTQLNARLIASLTPKVENTENGLKDHKKSNSHLTIVSVIGMITIVSSIAGAILFVIK